MRGERRDARDETRDIKNISFLLFHFFRLTSHASPLSRLTSLVSHLSSMKKFILLFVFVLAVVGAQAQMVTVEGYAFAANNQGYLNEVVVTAYAGDKPQGDATMSNMEGQFEMQLPAGMDYRFVASKAGFKENEIKGSTKGKAAGDKIYVKIPMDRSPGYIFEATLAEGKTDETVEKTDAIRGATIEIYNNTKKKPELVLRQHEKHTFSHTFEKGNQYIVLIRKEGFYTKRLQANVDVNGCLLCFEGLSNVQPGISDNLTAENSAGTLVANIDMRRIVIGEAIEVNNILYEYSKWNITPTAALELDKLAGLLNDNPNLVVELGAHTDCRDLQASNQILSEKRAKSAVEYLVNTGKISPNRLSYKGYGEMQLKLKECDCNKAKTPAQKCTEDQHAQNRRTEFKVLQVLAVDEENQGSLASSMMEQSMDEILAELENSVIKVPEGGFPPKEVADDVAKAKAQTDKAGVDAEEWEKIMRGEGEVIQIPADAQVPKTTAPSAPKTTPAAPRTTLSAEEQERIMSGGSVGEVVQVPADAQAPKTTTSAAEQERIMRGEGEVIQVPADAQLPKPKVQTNTTQEVKKGQFETNEAPSRSVEKPALGKGQAAPKSTLPAPRTNQEAPKVEQETTQPNTSVTYPSSRSIEQAVETTTQEVVETAKDKVTLPTPRRDAEEASTPNLPAPVTDADAKPATPTPPSKPRVVASEGKGAIRLPANYTGFKIQLIGAPSPLPKTHEIFREFAFVTVQQTMIGEYLYMIGDFRNEIQAQTFMDRNIIGRFAEAQVVHFQEGKRVN